MARRRRQLNVKTPEGAYDILIEAELLSRIRHEAETFGLHRRVAIVTNTTLAPIYGEMLLDALPNAALITVPDGEAYKTLETTSTLYTEFVSAKLDRSSTVIGFGGGVVGDMAGFAAATFMRGVRFVQMPTSLLSMVDSSVGGKVGVDLPQGKNLVGAFKQPEMVLIDPTFLKTLPEKEWRCGMAEVIKHGFLADEKLLDPALWSLDDAEELVTRAVQVKVDVVEADPFEKGIRAHLNLGHTFAHAIENVSHYAWSHGEAVGIGLVAAGRLSARLGLCGVDVADRVESIVEQTGLPTRYGNLDPEAIYAAMSTDKKWIGGRSRFVLLEGFGKPTICEGVAKSEVVSVLESMR